MGKWGKQKENEREGGKLKMEGGKVIKWGEDLFWVFCFSLLKTTEICFGSTIVENFYIRKKHFTVGKKSGKITLPPQKKFSVTPLLNCGDFSVFSILRKICHSRLYYPVTTDVNASFVTLFSRFCLL